MATANPASRVPAPSSWRFAGIVVDASEDPETARLGRSIMNVTFCLFMLAFFNFVFMILGGFITGGVLYLLVPFLIATCGYYGIKERSRSLVGCFTISSLAAAFIFFVFAALSIFAFVTLLQMSPKDCHITNSTCVCDIHGHIRFHGYLSPCNTTLRSLRWSAGFSMLFALLMGSIYCTGYTSGMKLQSRQYFSEDMMPLATNFPVNTIPVVVAQPAAAAVPAPAPARSVSADAASKLTEDFIQHEHL